VRLAVRVLVAYQNELPPLLALMVELAQQHPRVLREPEVTAQVVNLGENGIEIELGFWIADPERGSQSVRSDINVALLAAFRARGIEFPTPQREVKLVGARPDQN
jgi:small-conductance mechanosensitive channel